MALLSAGEYAEMAQLSVIQSHTYVSPLAERYIAEAEVYAKLAMTRALVDGFHFLEQTIYGLPESIAELARQEGEQGA